MSGWPMTPTTGRAPARMAAEEKRKLAVQIIEEEAQEDPKKALGMAEGYKLADPGARTSPSVARVDGILYYHQVRQALAVIAVQDAEVRWEEPRRVQIAGSDR